MPRYEGEGYSAEADAIVKHPKAPSLRLMKAYVGDPPWDMEIGDMWERTIPQEATDLIGALIWRGVRFTREDR